MAGSTVSACCLCVCSKDWHICVYGSSSSPGILVLDVPGLLLVAQLLLAQCASQMVQVGCTASEVFAVEVVLLQEALAGHVHSNVHLAAQQHGAVCKRSQDGNLNWCLEGGLLFLFRISRGQSLFLVYCTSFAQCCPRLSVPPGVPSPSWPAALLQHVRSEERLAALSAPMTGARKLAAHGG